MANTKSAKKQIKINERNRLRNLRYRTRMKSALKKARATITASEFSDADASGALLEAQRTIYKTASKGVIHKNTASRKYGRLVSLFRKVRVMGLEFVEDQPKAKASPAPPVEVVTATEIGEAPAAFEAEMPADAHEPEAVDTGEAPAAIEAEIPAGEHEPEAAETGEVTLDDEPSQEIAGETFVESEPFPSESPKPEVDSDSPSREFESPQFTSLDEPAGNEPEDATPEPDVEPR